VFEQFFALQAKCVRPTSQEAYIKSVSGGRNMSPEVHLKVRSFLGLLFVGFARVVLGRCGP